MLKRNAMKWYIDQHMTQCVVLCLVTLSHNMDVYSWVQLFGDHPKSTNHVERHTHPFKSSSPSVKFLNNNSRQNAQYVVDENNSNHGKLEKRLNFKKIVFLGKQKSSIFDDHNTFYAKLRMPEKMWIKFCLFFPTPPPLLSFLVPVLPSWSPSWTSQLVVLTHTTLEGTPGAK